MDTTSPQFVTKVNKEENIEYTFFNFLKEDDKFYYYSNLRIYSKKFDKPLFYFIDSKVKVMSEPGEHFYGKINSFFVSKKIKQFFNNKNELKNTANINKLNEIDFSTNVTWFYNSRDLELEKKNNKKKSALITKRTLHKRELYLSTHTDIVEVSSFDGFLYVIYISPIRIQEETSLETEKQEIEKTKKKNEKTDEKSEDLNEETNETNYNNYFLTEKYLNQLLSGNYYYCSYKLNFNEEKTLIEPITKQFETNYFYEFNKSFAINKEIINFFTTFPILKFKYFQFYKKLFSKYPNLDKLRFQIPKELFQNLIIPCEIQNIQEKEKEKVYIKSESASSTTTTTNTPSTSVSSSDSTGIESKTVSTTNLIPSGGEKKFQENEVIEICIDSDEFENTEGSEEEDFSEEEMEESEEEEEEKEKEEKEEVKKTPKKRTQSQTKTLNKNKRLKKINYDSESEEFDEESEDFDEENKEEYDEESSENKKGKSINKNLKNIGSSFTSSTINIPSLEWKLLMTEQYNIKAKIESGQDITKYLPIIQSIIQLFSEDYRSYFDFLKKKTMPTNYPFYLTEYVTVFYKILNTKLSFDEIIIDESLKSSVEYQKELNLNENELKFLIFLYHILYDCFNARHSIDKNLLQYYVFVLQRFTNNNLEVSYKYYDSTKVYKKRICITTPTLSPYSSDQSVSSVPSESSSESSSGSSSSSYSGTSRGTIRSYTDSNVSDLSEDEVILESATKRSKRNEAIIPDLILLSEDLKENINKLIKDNELYKNHLMKLEKFLNEIKIKKLDIEKKQKQLLLDIQILKENINMDEEAKNNITSKQNELNLLKDYLLKLINEEIKLNEDVKKINNILKKNQSEIIKLSSLLEKNKDNTYKNKLENIKKVEELFKSNLLFKFNNSSFPFYLYKKFYYLSLLILNQFKYYTLIKFNQLYHSGTEVSPSNINLNSTSNIYSPKINGHIVMFTRDFESFLLEILEKSNFDFFQGIKLVITSIQSRLKIFNLNEQDVFFNFNSIIYDEDIFSKKSKNKSFKGESKTSLNKDNQIDNIKSITTGSYHDIYKLFEISNNNFLIQFNSKLSTGNNSSSTSSKSYHFKLNELNFDINYKDFSINNSLIKKNHYDFIDYIHKYLLTSIRFKENSLELFYSHLSGSSYQVDPTINISSSSSSSNQPLNLPISSTESISPSPSMTTSTTTSSTSTPLPSLKVSQIPLKTYQIFDQNSSLLMKFKLFNQKIFILYDYNTYYEYLTNLLLWNKKAIKIEEFLVRFFHLIFSSFLSSYIVNNINILNNILNNFDNVEFIDSLYNNLAKSTAYSNKFYYDDHHFFQILNQDINLFITNVLLEDKEISSSSSSDSNSISSSTESLNKIEYKTFITNFFIINEKIFVELCSILLPDSHVNKKDIYYQILEIYKTIKVISKD